MGPGHLQYMILDKSVANVQRGPLALKITMVQKLHNYGLQDYREEPRASYIDNTALQSLGRLGLKKAHPLHIADCRGLLRLIARLNSTYHFGT